MEEANYIYLEIFKRLTKLGIEKPPCYRYYDVSVQDYPVVDEYTLELEGGETRVYYIDDFKNVYNNDSKIVGSYDVDTETIVLNKI